jgi:fumarate reductase flavoprotein subunit
MTLNQYRVEASLARRLCDGAADGLAWLTDLGVEFRSQDLYASGVESVPRGHAALGNGAAIAAALEAAVSRRAIDVALNTRVSELVTSADCRVCGIRSGDTTVRAGAVVVTTGGFGANPYLLHQHYPDAAASGDWAWYIGSRHPRCAGCAVRHSTGRAPSDRGALQRGLRGGS